MITMVFTNQNAYDILGLPSSADLNTVTTKYKQLAIHWHPEKHKYSTESVQKFQQVTLAFKKLTSSECSQDIKMTDCLSVFQQVVFNRAATNGTKYNYSDSSDNSDDDDDDDSDDSDDEPQNNLFNKKDISRKDSENGYKDLTEEERERRKAEKRRAKKKRQRERKRLEKELKTNGSNKTKTDKKGVLSQEKSTIPRDSSSEDEPLFDPNSAFFTKVVSKKKKNSLNVDPPQPGKKEKTQEKKSDEEVEEFVDPKVLRSRQLAIRGNEMAQVDEYTAAIQLFTEAINLDSTDFRFFGNRSYCFDRIEQYDKALRDAEKAIKLDKDWPKGHFRKGRALAGLKMFGDAEKAFMQVLKLDKSCEDAVAELLRVRTHQLMDMGFSKHKSEAAIKKYGSVQAALDSLLAGVGDNTLFISDDEDEGFNVHRPAPIPPATANPSDVKMDPTNPEGLTALWVGNVLPTVTEKRLNQLFSKFGPVTSVRPLPEKFCAFVNFKTKEAAGRAMHQLQGTEVDGQKLLIKFPDNPLTNSTGNLTIRKNVPIAPTKQGVRNTPKQSGPVNGDECYFWRTTGCTFGSDCKWQHYPQKDCACKLCTYAQNSPKCTSLLDIQVNRFLQLNGSP
ncbi:nucleolin-like isoform X2 [Biomphalaria glabrata]|uniref:Nucleolin-like isoform X2 n=1 Tax=Biomphalaria glabrata TaxID=6526 RepID=A0A9W3A507_BIOGL|nr:nucleolin-like isoform X2 [Biomphalaria glabrata]